MESRRDSDKDQGEVGSRLDACAMEDILAKSAAFRAAELLSWPEAEGKTCRWESYVLPVAY